MVAPVSVLSNQKGVGFFKGKYICIVDVVTIADERLLNSLDGQTECRFDKGNLRLAYCSEIQGSIH